MSYIFIFSNTLFGKNIKLHIKNSLKNIAYMSYRFIFRNPLGEENIKLHIKNSQKYSNNTDSQFRNKLVNIS